MIRVVRRPLVCLALAVGTAVTVARGAPAQSATRGATPILLWPAGAPGALGNGDADQPAITPYLPPQETATGAAAVVFPGGGYEHLATDKEGTQIAAWLNHLGVAAFVVRYRLGPRYHAPVMQRDALRAVRVVRAHAGEWHVDPSRIGVAGFSAGGHMASTAGTHFDAGDPASADPVERVSSRPSFMLLAYPVVTMTDPYAHHGSRAELLGDVPTSAAIDSTSNELHVTRDTPPTFIVATTDDASVPVENSLLFYRALHAAGVGAELHLFQHGRHGFGLAASDPALSAWPALAAEWLRANGWLTAPVH
jgi:acetyl esterase/lipase